MAMQIFLSKNHATIIQLYLSLDDKSIKDISDNRHEILMYLQPVLEDKVPQVLIDEKLISLIEGLFDDEYEGVFFNDFGNNFEKFDILKRKIVYAKHSIIRKNL